MSVLKHDRTFTQPIIWTTTGFMLLFHLGAIAALFVFSWKALGLAALLWWVAGSLGIGMGYHRLLTHRGYKTPKWVEYFLTICGTLALEGGPIFWVATHRMHHQNTDKEGDPHSPRDGGFWAHMGWIITGKAMHNKTDSPAALRSRSSQRQISCLDQRMALGSADRAWRAPSGLWRMAVSDVGNFLRTVFGLHSTWLVNSATHMWGSQRFHDRRRLDQQLLGRDPHLRRGLAQQPPRRPAGRPPRHCLVRDRSELVRDLALRMLGLAWDISLSEA